MRVKKISNTTIIALLLLAVLTVCLGLVFFGKTTLAEVGTFLSVVTTLAAGLGFKLAADNKTQDNGNH